MDKEFKKEIHNVEYNVKYSFRKNYSYPVTFFVNIKAVSFKRKNKNCQKTILNYFQLKSMIEQELFMPVV